ncbi:MULTISPECIES: enoyl-ACP reductase FabI [Holzapfeliella]
MSTLMQGKKIVVMGVANSRSIAWGCAKALEENGAEVIYTYQNDRMKKSLTRTVGEDKSMIACDVADDDNVTKAFEEIHEKHGNIDGVIHAIAFADKETLEGGVLNTKRDGYRMAQDISSYSLIAVSRAASRIMNEGGSIATLTYFGSTRAIPNYNMMGIAKAALESSVRYLARDLGPQKIRVNSISAGAMKTLAVTGIKEHSKLLQLSRDLTVDGNEVTLEEIGNVATFLMSPLSTGVTGDVIYVDKGVHLS